MNVLKLSLAVGALGASLVAAAPASAVITTFATFSALNSNSNVDFVNSGNGNTRTTDATFFTTATKTAKVPGTVDVRFSLLQAPIADFVNNVVAAFTLNAVVSKNSPTTGSFNQPHLSGTFSFISTTAITVTGPFFTQHTYAAGSNLLSGSFGNTVLTGSGSSGSVAGSNLSANEGVTFTSDLLDFTPTIQHDLALAITSVRPSFAKHTGINGALASFRGNAGGQFSSDPAPLINGLAIVPEPGVWMLMVAGFGLVGVSARRRGRSVAA